MGLLEKKMLFLDCQTTGMRPSSGHLLEIAWSFAHGTEIMSPASAEIHSRLLQLPKGTTIPHRITEITGIQNSDLERAHPPADIFGELLRLLQAADFSGYAVIHHAPFEEPFLKEFFKTEDPLAALPFQIIDTAKIAKKLLPALPSRNIRALAGYFGLPIGEFKRAGEHVQATLEIWKSLALELEKIGVTSPEQIETWLREAPKAPPAPYQYRIDKEFRLQLPDKPGIYRMIAKNEMVLYVGKATSLKSRVNSYFRGKKGRDAKKLEMLTQVWRVEVTPTGSALEAALLENEEIKRLNPPYNILLKTGRRQLAFFNRDFSASSPTPDAIFYRGPFRPQNYFENLQRLAASTVDGEFRQIFYDPVPEDILVAGFALFCQTRALEPRLFSSVRSSVAWSLRLFRNLRPDLARTLAARHDAHAETDEPGSTSRETAERECDESDLTASGADDGLSIEDVADKFERLFLRAAHDFLRARKMTRLLDADIHWQLTSRSDQESWKTLRLRRGRVFFEEACGEMKASGMTTEANLDTAAVENENLAAIKEAHPWSGLSIIDYDRLSILVAELAKHPHRIESIDRIPHASIHTTAYTSESVAARISESASTSSPKRLSRSSAPGSISVQTDDDASVLR